METIAIYWEPIIKTYGLFTVRNVVLFSKRVPPHALADTGRVLAGADFERQPEIALIAAAATESGCLRLSVAVHLKGSDRSAAFQMLWSQIPSTDERSQSADLLYFQGPHFGDRFGIAHAVQNDLSRFGLTPLLLVCSASSVYILVQSGMADRAAEALSRSFQHPPNACAP